MRLLKRLPNGDLQLTSVNDDNPPPYAILSHTWIEGQEVTYQELVAGAGKDKTGYAKICFCAEKAAEDGLLYSWVDTCCIDKSTSLELQTAINSMFRWYQGASKCYVYLSDVQVPDEVTDAQAFPITWKHAFRRSKWFTRGWTLQELLAPASVEFFCEGGKRLGSRISLEQEIHKITGIPIEVLRGQSLTEFNVEERMSWAARRTTTLKEDKVYCLLGIFGVFLALIYGEGEAYATLRLKEEIQKRQDGQGTKRLHDLIDHRDKTCSPINAQATPTHYLPFSRNRRFVGRGDKLQELRRKLLVDEECSKVAVVGLGGIGKTQIALEFAQSVKRERPEYSVLWVSAVSLESFEQSCTEIARLLHILRAGDGKDDVKELVRQYLNAQAAGKWLLVVDNADDKQVLFGTDSLSGIVNFLPENDNGVMVFTSRRREVAEALVSNDVIEVGKMSKEEAISFSKASLRTELVDEDAIKQLVAELDYLPLAIVQAVAYVNTNTATISKYLELIQNTEDDLITVMSREFYDSTRKQATAVATTWVISFNQILAEDTVAADILAFMSCVEWKGIPLSILPTVQPEAVMVHAIGTICSYAFIAKREDEDVYDMHRLVHLAMRIWLDRNGRAVKTRKKAIGHVAKAFPSDDYENRYIWREYLPHASRLSRDDHKDSAEEKSELEIKVGRCLLVDGRISEAEAWLRKSCEWREKHLVEDNSLRLSSQHVLAMTYHANGQVKEAIALLEHVVVVKGQVLVEDHPDRLASQHALAMAYEANGQVKEAIALLEHVVAVEGQVLMEDHPNRLASQHALAGAYEVNGQVKEALTLLEHVVAVEGQVLMEDHPDRLASQHALAMAYEANGQVKAALTLLEHVVAIKKTVFAQSHPSRIVSEEALAIMRSENAMIS